jgi:hypothetical protein
MINGHNFPDTFSAKFGLHLSMWMVIVVIVIVNEETEFF